MRIFDSYYMAAWNSGAMKEAQRGISIWPKKTYSHGETEKSPDSHLTSIRAICN